MKILLIQDDCSVGGHTFLRLENAKGLVARGHEVVCFFFNDLGYLEQFQKACPALTGDGADLLSLLKSEAFDIVHGDPSMLDLPYYLSKSGCASRLVLTRHAVDSPVGWLASDCDGYIAESATSAALMQPYTDLPVTIVPNGIDTSTIHPVACAKPPRPIIAWCGRSGADFKNIALYLQVTRDMDRSAFDFWVADGDAGMARPDQGEFGDTSYISTWRRFGREEFPVFYSQITASGGCLLGTSLYEGLPLTILEALACGCPIVAMDSRGVNDVMAGGLEKWLYPPKATADDVRKFVLASLPVLHTPQNLGALRRHVLDHFSSDVMVEGNLRVYARSLQDSRKVIVDRKAIAERLWTHAAETMENAGRARDALFAIRAALRLNPFSILSESRLPLMLQALHRSRINGARGVRGARASIDETP